MKPRKPRTFHSACAFAVAVLSDDDVKAATGKSMSLLRRASDPDDHAVEIRCADAAALEAVLIEHGHAPQFMTAFQDAVEQHLGHGINHEPGNLLERLADAVEKVGNISAELRAATHPDSPGGASLVPFECDQVEAAICEAIDVLEAKRRDIQAIRNGGNVHDFNNKKEAS
ncbi:hypothetical protein [Thalassospira sp.]|uniref:hypothetical protein n=1 Tax=Thalassospira sp. TaxID=1912094 RepID=UPI000C6B9D3E|nr:hypothetical protein [Thalassospira sp.]MAL41411.1 hypothetical protein [Thalassospira sp.]|tara:strand:- start:2509 stop:3021 length:513 start_codon:yes stop_codon:yes gene_type:complete